MSATDSRVEADQNLTLALQNPLGYQHLSTADLIALAQTNATLYAAEQTAELVKQQQIANKIAVALVEQVGALAETNTQPGYPMSPALAIREYVTDAEWEGLGLS